MVKEVFIALCIVVPLVIVAFGLALGLVWIIEKVTDS